MTQKTRAELKSTFVSGYKPTQTDYANLFDSFLNFISDQSVLDAKLNASILTAILNLTKEPTGFTNNSNITVSYNSTTRKVTLSGTFAAYMKGALITELINGWESIAHADVNGNYYLYVDTNGAIQFTTVPWTYDCIMIAFIQYQTAYKIGLRETHGLMQNEVHQYLHEFMGTFLKSGGDLSSFVLSSTTAANRRPDIALTVVKDEDNESTLDALSSKLYTQRFLSGASVKNYTTDAADIIPLSTNQPYWNQFTGGNWVQTLFANNEYGAIFIVAIPTTNDAGSKKFRYLFIQPQQVSTTLSVIQGLTPNNLVHGDASILLSEFVFIGKIIIQYTGGNWTLISVEKLTGSRFSQVGMPSGSYLSAVSTGNTMSGNGTPGNPLNTVKVNPRVYQIASGSSLAIDIDSYDSVDITALAAAFTFNEPTGTPLNKQKLLIDIKDNGTARGLSWNAAFVAGGTALPSTTVLGKQMSLVFIYDSTAAKWKLRSLAQDA